MKRVSAKNKKKGGPQCRLVIVSPESVQEKCNEIVEQMVKKEDLSCFYVALNKPQASLEKIFKQRGINTKKIFYVDCITSAVSVPKEVDNILFVPNPSELDAIMKAIKQLSPIIKDFGFILIDALRTLLIYNTEAKVVQFLKDLISLARKNNLKIVFVTAEGKDRTLIGKIQPLFDKIEK